MQEPQSHWFAVFTKPRKEHIALENLERQGFKCFLPLAENPFQQRSRNGCPQIGPLFPRYLFLNAVPEHQNLALVRCSRGVVDLVRFGTKLATLPEKTLELLRSRMDSATGLIRIKSVDFSPGDRVRLFDGPLAGVEGIVKVKNGARRAVLLMELFGRQTTVAVDALLLQRVA